MKNSNSMRLQKMSRLLKMTHILRIICQMMFWFLVLGGIMCLIGSIIMLLMPDSIFTVKATQKDIMLRFNSLYSYKISAAEHANTNSKPIFLIMIPMLSFISFMLSVITFQTIKILKTVENNNPFDIKNSERLTIIGIVFIVGSFVGGFAEFIISKTIVDIFKLPNILVNYNLNFGVLLPGLLFIVLSGVFRHGNYLQQEVDSIV